MNIEDMGENVQNIKIAGKKQSDCHVCFIVKYATEWQECWQEVSAVYIL